eukprot:CAMPEP_0116880738 /NCGR_PEP_ID=MMETSP0463-20121206/12708_1 /TAXON_ID=181622 /ORGANISM="Strombidinopsis sp, Strain SopsisLIS2011" /LENGTH=32 /DNA_ID= /DNA_START= /DNA_END= /DNA_ORIENTATION=
MRLGDILCIYCGKMEELCFDVKEDYHTDALPM